MTTGVLYLVATPIGNLEDITLRALRILREVEMVAAEDTRRTRELLAAYDIHTRLISYHQHSDHGKASLILESLQEGLSVALVSDAGMPGISDPGETLVREAIAHGHRVVSVPGASAALAALTVSGLPTGSFLFEGFLSRKAGARMKKLLSLSGEERTVIIYEAPHRLRATLEEMNKLWPDRALVVAREISKFHEEVVRGSVKDILEFFLEKVPRGEFTLVLGGTNTSGEEKICPEELAQRVRECVRLGCNPKEAISRVASLTGERKNEVYRAFNKAKWDSGNEKEDE